MNERIQLAVLAKVEEYGYFSYFRPEQFVSVHLEENECYGKEEEEIADTKHPLFLVVRGEVGDKRGTRHSTPISEDDLDKLITFLQRIKTKCFKPKKVKPK